MRRLPRSLSDYIQGVFHRKLKLAVPQRAQEALQLEVTGGYIGVGRGI